MAETGTDTLLAIATTERDHTRRLVAAHVSECTAKQPGLDGLAGECPDCRSLAAHLARCDRQVDLLSGDGVDADEATLW